MARYKPQESNSLLLPVVLSEQIVPGSFTSTDSASPMGMTPNPSLKRRPATAATVWPLQALVNNCPSAASRRPPPRAA